MSKNKELTLGEVLDHIERESGKPIKPSTWRAYVARGQAPRPVRYQARDPLYSAQSVDEWISTRPGAGARTDLLR